MSDIRVYTARRIHTMNPSMPRAQAVAVRDGRVALAVALGLGLRVHESDYGPGFPAAEMHESGRPPASRVPR